MGLLSGSRSHERQRARKQARSVSPTTPARNKALVRPEKVEVVLKEVLDVARRPHEPVEEPESRPVPLPVPKPVRKSARFSTWLLTAGGTIVTVLKEPNLVALDWRVQIAILVVIVGFAVYAITSMPAVRGALGLK